MQTPNNMMAITDTLSDDLLREVFTFLPVGSFLPIAHVCKTFKRCWILSKKASGDDKKNNDDMMIYSTKPFRVGLLYQFDWNHSCYDNVPPNSSTSMKRKETTAKSAASTLAIQMAEDKEETSRTTTRLIKKQKIESPSKAVTCTTLNQSLFHYFVCDMGWITKYRSSLLQRELMTKLLIMAAQRGDIEGMNYMLFEMEPIDLRTRLVRYCHRRRARSHKVKSFSTSSSNQEVDADINAMANALARVNEQFADNLARANEQITHVLAHVNEQMTHALAHANEQLDDPPLDDDEASLTSSSWAEDEQEEEESSEEEEEDDEANEEVDDEEEDEEGNEEQEEEEEEESEDEEMPPLVLPSTSPYNLYNATMVNVTPSVQELCLNMAAAGRLQALHWVLHTAFQMTWLVQKDGLKVHREAKSNDYADVAKYIMLTMSINFSPLKAHQRSAKAQLESMMGTTSMNSSCSTGSTTSSIGSNQD